MSGATRRGKRGQQTGGVLHSTIPILISLHGFGLVGVIQWEFPARLGIPRGWSSGPGDCGDVSAVAEVAVADMSQRVQRSPSRQGLMPGLGAVHTRNSFGVEDTVGHIAKIVIIIHLSCVFLGFSLYIHFCKFGFLGTHDLVGLSSDRLPLPINCQQH